MAHIPLGYKIVDGCAVVDEPTVEQIKATYRYYFEGKSLVDAAKEAGFKMNHATVKRMLSNKKYLGTDYYPQIIDEETGNSSSAEKIQLISRTIEERLVTDEFGISESQEPDFTNAQKLIVFND